MDRFTQWRHHVLHRLLQVLVVLGGIAYVPSVWLAVRVEAWSVVLLDTVAYALVVGLFAARQAPYAVRAGGILVIFYGIGVGLLAVLGPYDAGSFYLLAAPPIAAVFFGPRVTLGTFGAVAATVALIWQTGALHEQLLAPSTELSGVHGIVLSANALLTSGLISLAITLLVQGLRTSMAEVESKNHDLILERDRLEKAHAELLRSGEEREEIERRLRHSEKLTAIGTMAGGIAHDFNNLLTPIVGGLEILRHSPSTKDAHDDGADREILDDALRAALRGRDLVARLLGFARAEGEAPTEIDLAETVTESLRLLRASRPGNVQLEAVVDPEAGHVVLSPTDIHQIVLNLGTNAFHAMGGCEGVVTIQVGGASHALLPEGCDGARVWCLISVADTGSGMDAETLCQVFEPFFTSKPRGKGTGLGLPSVKDIARRAGGAVTVESEVGVGTTVRVFLPQMRADAGPGGGVLDGPTS